ncbi:MAG TPA: ATP-binding protein [Kofleriaceae bacterium]|nr:ATP-binding protein [Kofleriaceae bacterium]
MMSLLSRLRQFAALKVPPELANTDEDTRRRARLIVQFSLVIFVCGPVYGALYLALGMYVSALGAGLCAVSLGFTPRLFRRFPHIAVGAHWVTATCFVVLALVTVPTGGLAAPALGWLALVPVTALMLGGRRIGGIWTAISVAAVVGYFVLELSGHTPAPEVPARWVPTLELMVAAGLVGLIALLAWLYESNKDHMLSELRAAGDQVAQARDQYRALVESTRTIPWELDPGPVRFTYVGPQAVALLGCPVDDWLRGDFLTRRVHPDDRSPAFDAHWQCSGHDASHPDIEFRLRREDGRWAWVRSIISTSSNPQTVRGILLDVTQRRALELELQQAQKLESIGRLAAGVAHEINTPVQFVSDSVQFLQQSYSDLFPLLERYQRLRGAAASIPALAAAASEVGSAEADADLSYLAEHIPKAAERAMDGLARVATIVRSMKQFARADASDKAPADLNQALAATLVIARHEYCAVADIDLQLADLPLVVCHLGQLNQVFLNLIVNAAHSIAELAQRSPGRGRITVSSRQDGDRVKISIADTGAGIPSAIQHRVFEPFFTTKGVGKGTGQGLSIARGIVVDKHGGSLTFESEPDHGTIFTVALPIAGPAPAVARAS